MNLKQIGRRRKNVCVFTRKFFPVFVCLFFLLMGGRIVLAQGEKREQGNIRITAHRGASYKAPENTRASIELAIAEGADCVEIDVRMTADGVPVLLHDRMLLRTIGVEKEIDGITYEEASSYDAGAKYAWEFAGEMLPDLQSVLEEYGEKINFIIELKEASDNGLVEAVVTLVERFGLEEKCAVISEEYEDLLKVKKADSRIRTGYILSRVYGEIFRRDAVDFFCVRHECITKAMVDGAHREGKYIYAWTVNDAETMKKMVDMGVDHIITDRPAYARSVVK